MKKLEDEISEVVKEFIGSKNNDETIKKMIERLQELSFYRYISEGISNVEISDSDYEKIFNSMKSEVIHELQK